MGRRLRRRGKGVGPVTARCGRLFLEVRVTGGEEVLDLVPGQFCSAVASPDGRNVIAGDGRGQVYLFRLHCRDA
jgi:hypothetical protein